MYNQIPLANFINEADHYHAEIEAEASIPGFPHDPGTVPPQLPEYSQLQTKMVAWLQDLGLSQNPFDATYFDAGADPFLARYLVGHHAFEAIRRDQPAIVFAPVGGGKSAFRVRLARACRVGEDGRRILPIVYSMPRPTELLRTANSLDRHLHFISQAIAGELLLALAYAPTKYLSLDDQDRQAVAIQITANFVGFISRYLAQLQDEGTIDSLVAFIDPSAANLIAQPAPKELHLFCEVMQRECNAATAQISALRQLSASERFQQLLALTKEILDFQALYLLVDGVDAYIEASEQDRRRAPEFLGMLFRQTGLWAEEQFFVKYFLPTEFLTPLRFTDVLGPTQIITLRLVHIEWTPATLNEMLQERIRFASQGRFDDLDAICAADLRDVQAQIIDVTESLPREVLALSERLLIEHVRTHAEPDLLCAADLARAIAWYKGGGQ